MLHSPDDLEYEALPERELRRGLLYQHGSRSSSSLHSGRRRLACLLVALHAEPSLSGVLIKELSREIPDIRFTLNDAGELSVIWICGYERGAADAVARMRRTHPHATLIVTGRGPVELWGSEAISSGADRACSWPVNYEELCRFLHERHSEQRTTSSEGALR